MTLTSGRPALLGLLLQLLEIDLRIVVEHLEVAGADVVFVQVVHDLLELDRAGGAVEAVDRGTQRLLGGDHRVDRVAGHELDVVEREDVGGIGHRHGQTRRGFRDRQDGVLARELGGDDLDHRGVDLDLTEVDRGYAEVLGEEVDELGVFEVAETDQLGVEPSAGLTLRRESGVELLLADLPGLDQDCAHSVVHA